MKKNYQNFFFALLTLVFLSCSNEDEIGDNQNITPNNNQLVATINGEQFISEDVVLISSLLEEPPSLFSASRTLPDGNLQSISISFLNRSDISKITTETYSLRVANAFYSIQKPEAPFDVVDDQNYTTSVFNDIPTGKITITDIKFSDLGGIISFSGNFEFDAFKNYLDENSESVSIKGSFKNVTADNI